MKVKIKDTESSRGQWYAHLIGSTITVTENPLVLQYVFTTENHAIRKDDTDEIVGMSKEVVDTIVRTANSLTEKQRQWFQVKVKESAHKFVPDLVGQILDVYKPNDLWFHHYPTRTDILVTDCEVLADEASGQPLRPKQHPINIGKAAPPFQEVVKLDIDQQQFQESTPDEKKEMINKARQAEPFPGPNAAWIDNTRKLAFPLFSCELDKAIMKNIPPNDPVNRPAYYTDGKIEVIDFIEDKKLGFHLGNAIKYIARAGKKDPAKTIEDLEKARWYLDREIERLNLSK